MNTNTADAPAPAQDYLLAATLGAASPHALRRSLAGLSVGKGDAIHVLGDDQVRVFGARLDFVRGWPVSPGARCLDVDAAGQVLVGFVRHVEGFDAAGRRLLSFSTVEAGNPSDVTSVKTFRDEVLVGDAAARCIRRFDRSGRALGTVGDRDKTRGFMLPNRCVDFDVDAKGVIYATDTGRHRVASWALDGSPVSTFGRFGYENPGDFVGCCNPVNVALAPNGAVVTAEKMIARVKVYSRDGRLLALIGPAHFDQSTTHLHLAVDSTGRIVVGDPIRRELKIFIPKAS